ncbi:unnamed protein product [Trichogramma brassicae]|uniref:Uncharacterized protein n=1 Tax=Trichogramma brassicae TaxID=86971 RepID=A0A6H5J4R9_9HYME|nr:unnamed protein product [Trichogramma brassicae]
MGAAGGIKVANYGSLLTLGLACAYPMYPGQIRILFGAHTRLHTMAGSRKRAPRGSTQQQQTQQQQQQMICGNRAKRRIPCEIVIFTRIALHIAAELSGSSSSSGTYKHVCAHRKSAVRSSSSSSSICELERPRGRAEKSNKTSSELPLPLLLLQLRLATARAAAGGSSQVSYARRSSLSTHMRDDVNIRRSHCRTEARARASLTLIADKLKVTCNRQMCRGGVLRACNNIPRLGTRRKIKKKGEDVFQHILTMNGRRRVCAPANVVYRITQQHRWRQGDKTETRAKQAPSHTCIMCIDARRRRRGARFISNFSCATLRNSHLEYRRHKSATY